MENIQLAALVMGLTELVKGLGIPAKFCSLVSLVFAVALNIYIQGDLLVPTVLEGLAVGLAVTGLYKVVDDKLFSRLK